MDLVALQVSVLAAIAWSEGEGNGAALQPRDGRGGGVLRESRHWREHMGTSLGGGGGECGWGVLNWHDYSLGDGHMSQSIR